MSKPHTCSECLAMAACPSIKACDAFVLLLISVKAQFRPSARRPLHRQIKRPALTKSISNQ